MNRCQFLQLAACMLAALVPAAAYAGVAIGEPQLPDLIAWADPSPGCYMYCGFVDPDLVPGETIYRFRGALPNIGPGPLEVREVTHPNGTQNVFQRIYNENDQLYDERLIGSFPGADSIPPRHLWLPGIAQYNLREVLPGNGVGPVVATQDKTSMAVVDSTDYDKNLPGAPQSAVYDSVADPILGISVGWADVYGPNLPGQWITITNLADGQYWLEVIADPYDQIDESDEENNTTRILVDLVVTPPTILAGDYNRDGIVDAADYTVWRNTLGENLGPGEQLGDRADGDASGTIRAADYTIWKNNYGDTMPGAGGLTVPEPAISVLILPAIFACGFAPAARRRTVAATRP